MDANAVIDKLLEEEVYKELYERISKLAAFEKEDIITILLALSYINNGKADKALALLKPLHEKYKDVPYVAYWYASSLAGTAETPDECMNAKNLLLDALELGLEGPVKEDALLKAALLDEKIALMIDGETI